MYKRKKTSISDRMYEVHILAEGYSRLREDGVMIANGSCTLVIGEKFKVKQIEKNINIDVIKSEI